MEWKHRLSDIDPAAKTGTCAVCGPDSPLRYRKHREQWACWTSEKRRSPGARRRQREAQSARDQSTPLIGDLTYTDLLELQEGGCAICGQPEVTGRALAVDHCHATGRIRGLLCAKCNTALGLMHDDPERLLRAVEYLAA